MKMKKMFYVGALGAALASIGTAMAQVPNAPDAPTCTMVGNKSDCQFKDSISGTPTSVVGNRVILFRRSANGGHGDSRRFSEEAIKRLALRYNFTATVTEDPAIFTADNLKNTKVVIMSNGDGDVIPAGANRNALQDFNQVNGWGVIWIHAACAFITNGWTFGQQSCVQQYFHHNGSGTVRRVFVDSGTSASPKHGIKHPQTEFVLRDIPGWEKNRTFQTGDEYYCFQAPARNNSAVNVLLGYDRSSGLPASGCPSQNDGTTAGSELHNLAWTRSMGKGISLYNSIGHDVNTYTAGGYAGDSLLWRFIRYAAKDFEIKPVALFEANSRDDLNPQVNSGLMNLTFRNSGRNDVLITDINGKKVFSKSFTGVSSAEIPNLKRGLYFVRVASNKKLDSKKVRIL